MYAKQPHKIGTRYCHVSKTFDISLVTTVMANWGVRRTRSGRHLLLRDVGGRMVCNTLYSSVKRDPRFNTLTSDDLNFFRNLLGPNGVITDVNELAQFNIDWTHRYSGNSALAVCPRNTSQVSAIMRYCNNRRLAIVPQGGNTGLVGGSVPVFDEIVLSLSQMNRIQSFDTSSGIAVVMAGVTHAQMDTHVAAMGFKAPVDIAPRNQCQIGGSVATNAAGAKFVRYGSMRDSIVGLEVVLSDGQVLDTLSVIRKDNTGYDLKQLFIGSEGTLGVITRVAVACPIRPVATTSALLRICKFSHIDALLTLARRLLPDVLSAFEFLDDHALQLQSRFTDDDYDSILPVDAGFSKDSGIVLVEVAGANARFVYEMLEEFVRIARREGIVSNGIVARDSAHASGMWRLREGLSAAVRKAGTAASFKYDVSLPFHAYYTCVTATRARLMGIEGVDVVSWGHIADGNLHLNITVANEKVVSQVKRTLEPWLYQFISEHNGSISAEHGLGIMKADAISYSKGTVAVDLMRVVKQTLDPHGICNPYKVLSQHESQV